MANTDKFLISIIGKQTVDGESDRVEVITTGKFMKKSDRWFIGYKEYSQDEPLSHYDNLIKVDGDIVTISRKGEIRSQLILELNKPPSVHIQHACGEYDDRGVHPLACKPPDRKRRYAGGKLHAGF